MTEHPGLPNAHTSGCDNCGHARDLYHFEALAGDANPFNGAALCDTCNTIAVMVDDAIPTQGGMSPQVVAAYERQTGRKIAGLRGDTRDRLDGFLIRTADWPRGAGRSSFILAALDLYEANPAIRDAFHITARRHEARLTVECPWGQGA